MQYLNNERFFTVVDCRVPTLPAAKFTGLSRAYTTTTFNSTVTYTCAIGYGIVGMSVRTCLDSGQWSGEPPQCQNMSFPLL